MALGVSIIGGLRYSVGILLHQIACLKNRHLAGDVKRRADWAMAEKLAWLLRGRADFDNRFDVPWRPLVFDRLCRKASNRAGYAPPTIHGDVPPTSPERPLFVAIVHYRITHSVLPFLHQQTGKEISVICSKGNADALPRRVGIYGSVPVEPILFDKTCYLGARNAFRQGRIVVSCIDYTERTLGWMSHDIWLDASMFDFPLKFDADILFAHPEVMADGTLELHCQLAERHESADAICEDFLGFLAEKWTHREPRRLSGRGRARETRALKSHLWVPTRFRFPATRLPE
jgi:hypothetical protein